MKVMMMVATIVALPLALLGSSTAAFAKKHTMHTTEARHCQLKGAEVSKSKSACKKAGGTWMPGAPTLKAPAESEPNK